MTYPSSSYYYECRYAELAQLLTFSSSCKKLTHQQGKILQLTAARRRISSSDLTKEFPYSKKPIEYGNAKKNLRKLRKLNLLERDYHTIDGRGKKKNNNSKMRHYYRLSKYGIYNLISNNRNLQFDIAKALLLNYNNHILWGFFLFPYIKRETLSKPEIDSSIFSEIFSYLHECCKQLEEMIFNIKHIGNQSNGYLTRQLFVWENIPQIANDRENLRNFLIQKLGWDWLDRAVFEKPDASCMTVSYESRSILIKRDGTLSFRGRKKYEFVIRELVNGQLAVDIVLSEPIQLIHMKIFLISYVTRLPKFIISLISHYNPNHLSPTMEILRQDERFIQVLKKTENDINRRCKLIVEGIVPETRTHGNALLFSSF